MNRTEKASIKKENPFVTANVFSRATFWWLKDFFRLGIKGGIDQDAIYETKASLQSRGITETYTKHWESELKRKKPSVLRFLFKEHGGGVLFWGLTFSLAESLMRIIQPLCLGGLVSYFAPGQTELTKEDAYWYAAGIIVSSAVTVFTFHPLILYIFEIGTSMRIGCSGLIYKKAMSLPKSAVSEGLNGKVINLLSNDLARFEIALAFFHDIWKGPMEALLFTYFIYQEIGAGAIIGIAFLLSFIPLQAYIGKKSAQLRLRTAKRTDFRVKIMNEIILGIQVIKMYTWEKSFATLVAKIRKKEISAVRGTSYIRATLFSFGMVSRLSIFLSLISYIYFGNFLTARKVFIVSSYFNILNLSMVYFWPVAITSVAEGYISVKRVQEFLLTSDEKPQLNTTVYEESSKNDKDEKKISDFKRKNVVNEVVIANGTNGSKIVESKESEKLLSSRRTVNIDAKIKGLSLDNASAAWELSENDGAGIHNFNLKIVENELCAVVGQVGAGKSTLLQVILGELDLDSGLMNVDGVVSYAAQEAWLFEGSIRSNIVFIEEFDERRYKEVVKVCALERDFKLLPYGDSTVVGERGISLSGGQKARVNLARAIYKKADIYLLDDPLSAVDTHVGKHIFQECIQNYLKDKICVLVTHQLQYLKDVRHLVLINHCRIEAQGTYSDLRALKIDSLLSTQGPDESAAVENKKRIERQRSLSCSSVGSKIIEDDNDRNEQQAIGAVSWAVYKSYFQAVNNRFYIVLVMILFILAQLGLSVLDFFVAQWVNWEERIATEHSQQLNQSDSMNSSTLSTMVADSMNSSIPNTLEVEETQREFYILTYSILMGVATCVYVYRTFAFFAMCLRASINLHDKIFRGITRATMFFFNNNPSGRILNRFSKDISSIDTILPPALIDCLACFLEFLFIVVIVVIVNYWLLIPTLVMSLLFYLIRFGFIGTSRSVKRVESITLSPIYSHTNATLQGLSTIRAFNAHEILQNEFYNHVDNNTGAWYLKATTTRAFALWLDIVCLLYISVVTLSFVVFDVAKGHSGNVGLVILQCINMIGMCQWGMRQTAEIENQMTSVERVMEYAELPSEPPLESEPKYRPPEGWPANGEISFKELNFKYSDNGTYVLKDINIHIRAKEKIGIVGRTGAGKSSIIQALFRLAKLDGVIQIDGIETNSLGLHDLRNKISIIPQDPVLFSGTLRFNLDPFDERTDEQLWSVLSEVELKTVVAGMAGGLDCKMSDGGSNFSMGQRQLVCLARAILRQNKILIMDEATANVDPETDRLIQATIRDKFRECTVLTIAHRLHTVMDNDRVLVVDAGYAVEFGHPYELLQRSDGYLRQLIDQTGPETASILTQAAAQCYSKLSPENRTL